MDESRQLERLVAERLGAYLGVQFETQVAVPIGNPPKAHKFDLVSSDRRHVVECKAHAFTVSGNNPSAKLSTMNEAVLYLSHLPRGTTKYLALKRDAHPQRQETLAEYYSRTYAHLLGDIIVIEFDLKTGNWQFVM